MIITGGIDIGPGITISPGVVTSGLQLYLDAAGYIGSGTTWDADTGPDATLINTPTYTASSPTYFSFAPTSLEYATTSNLGDLNTWTVESWFRVTSSLTGQVTAVVCNQFDLTNKLNFSIGTNNAPSSYNIVAGFFNGSWRNTTGFAPSLNTWYQVVGTYDGSAVKQYINGAFNTQLVYSGTPQSGGQVRIAGRWDNLTAATDFFPGDISIVRIYNTALSLSDIQQNYNAEKSRFGL